MQRAIEYLTRLRDLAKKNALAFDEDFRADGRNSVYWRDYYAYDKAVDALMDAPEIPAYTGINFERFRAALEKAGFTPEESMRINGALVGSMLGRRIDDVEPSE